MGTTVATQMIVLFAIVIVGYGLNRLKMIDQEFNRKLSNFVINISCPCLIASSVMTGRMPDALLILPLLALSFATYAFLIVLAFVIPRYMPISADDQGFYGFMITFGNVGFIGYPVVASIFGNDAVFYASILNFPNTLLVFVIGTLFISGSYKHVRFDPRVLYSPGLIASYLSIFIVAFGLETPKPVSQVFTLLGNMTVPSALIIIGSSMAQVPVRRMLGSRGIYIMTFLRLLVIPYVILQISRFLDVNELISNINVIIMAMPVASFGTLFCIKYGRGEEVMAQGTFITTLLSVVTIPIVAMFL